MKEVGTLGELGVKAGDVVECVGWLDGDDYCNGRVYTVHEKHPKGFYDDICAVSDGSWTGESLGQLFRIISRATPKLWRDMTPEEKSELLLAAHEGEKIEGRNVTWKDSEWVNISAPSWHDNCAYRIKPNPKVEVVVLDGRDIRFTGFIKGHKITFNLIDGKPDCASVKMEEL